MSSPKTFLSSGTKSLGGMSTQLINTEELPSTGISQLSDKSREQFHQDDVYPALRAEKKILSLEAELAQTRNELTQARDKIVDLETAIELKERQLRAALEDGDRLRIATEARSNIKAAAESQEKRHDQGLTLAAKSKSASANRGVTQQSLVVRSASDNLALLDELPFSVSRNADDRSPLAAKAPIPADTLAAPLYQGSARNSASPTSARRSAAQAFFFNPPAIFNAQKYSATMTEATAARRQRQPSLFDRELPSIQALESKKRSEDAAVGKVVEPEDHPKPVAPSKKRSAREAHITENMDHVRYNPRHYLR